MEFVEVAKAKARMCASIMKCTSCPLSNFNNETGLNCETLINECPEKAEEIIMKWAEENPVKTNRQVFEEALREKFGDTFDISKLVGLIARLNTCQIYRNSCPDVDDCFECSQKKFWDEEYKEVPKKCR